MPPIPQCNEAFNLFDENKNEQIQLTKANGQYPKYVRVEREERKPVKKQIFKFPLNLQTKNKPRRERVIEISYGTKCLEK